jgi:hypothetical protein
VLCTLLHGWKPVADGAKHRRRPATAAALLVSPSPALLDSEGVTSREAGYGKHEQKSRGDGHHYRRDSGRCRVHEDSAVSPNLTYNSMFPPCGST